MSGKKVILCEGQHDLIFLSLVIGSDQNIILKNWSQICSSSDTSGERVTIQNFLRPRCHYSYLIKQDENRNTCIDHFWMIYSFERDYPIRAVLDSDCGVTLDSLKHEMIDSVKKDLLNRVSDCMFSVKCDEESGVFLYPDTLTKEVKRVTGRALDSIRGYDEQKAVLEQFTANAPEWVNELREFLLK